MKSKSTKSPRNIQEMAVLPKRPLGKIGVEVTILGLGGEGVLRTFNQEEEAVSLINRAIDLGITYFESARAYSGSESYYGMALSTTATDHQEPHPHPNPPPEGEGILWGFFPTWGRFYRFFSLSWKFFQSLPLQGGDQPFDFAQGREPVEREGDGVYMSL